MSRKTRLHGLWTVLVVCSVVVLSVAPLFKPSISRAQGPGEPQPVLPGSLERAPAPQALTQARPGIGLVAAGTDPATFRAARGGQVNIIVQLTEPAAALAALRAGPNTLQAAASAQNQIARVEAAQDAVLSNMKAEGIDYTVLASTERAVSTVVVRADITDVPAIQQLPGVAAAYVERIGTFDNSTSVPFVRAPLEWAAGYTGQGMRVGLIDSGIDYDHVNFGGNGNGVPDPGEFPTAKIAGGYDFVGNSWDPNTSPALVPDADPYDQNGHGSHVAGTMAGFGVTGAGATYTGAYDASTPFSSMRIGPGVAPEAAIYVYKVGSVSNYVSEAAAILALDRVVDPNQDGDFSDHLDVVNMSIGGIYGTPDVGWAAAVDAAAQIGVAVVASAGNEGDVFYILGDPSTANRAISVASSSDGSLAWELVAPSTGLYEAAGASFGPQSYSVTAPLVAATDAVAPITDACEPITNTLTGSIALVDRGTCNFTVKVKNAQNAGALGVLVANSATGVLGGMGGEDPTITIPSVMITYADGQMLRALLGGGAVAVRLDSNLVYGATADRLSSFSSRGPQRRSQGADVAIKPDLAAPGDSITSTALGTGNGAVNFGGTSMASPHVAGAVALLRQQHPTWSVQEIKALVMNTATHPLTTNGVIQPSPIRTGTGRLDVGNAGASDVILYGADAPELVNVSFGVLSVSAPISVSKSITVENKGSSAATYDLSLVQNADIAGAAYSLSANQVTVPSGGTATINVTLSADPAAMPKAHSHDPSVSETQDGFPRQWMAEEAALLRLTPVAPTTAPELWLALWSDVRPVATRTVGVPTVALTGGMTGLDIVPFTGTLVATGGALPYDVVSLAGVFELLDSSPDDTGPWAEGFYNAADLEYVGLTTNYRSVLGLGGDLYNNGQLFFGLSTYGEWSSLAEETWFEIYIDSDQDGAPDFVVFNWNLGRAAGGDTDDVWIPVIVELATGDVYWYGDYVNHFSPRVITTYGFQNRVLFMPVWAGAVGLTDADADFDFWVASWYLDDTLVDVSDVMTYDPTRQGLDFTAGGPAPFWFTSGAGFLVEWDWSVYQGPNPPCALLLHPINVDALRAETLCFEVQAAYDLGLTMTVSDPTPAEGDTITYALTVTNNDPASPVSALVTVEVPGLLDYVSDTPSQGSYSPAGKQWVVGQLLPGASATLEIEATVKVGAAGRTISNTARAEASVGTDTNPADNTATATIVVAGGGAEAPVLGMTDLANFKPVLTKVGVLQAGGLGVPGETITWTITVTNSGTATGFNIPVVDTLPDILHVDGADADRGTVGIVGQTVTFLIDRLDPGETVELRIYSRILHSPLDGIFTNSAAIVTPEGVMLAGDVGRVSGVGMLPSTGYPPAGR